jgi:TctA family transporter
MSARASMAAAAQQQRAATDPSSAARRIRSVASVSSATLTGVQLGQSSMVDLQLTVMLPAGIPVPITQTVAVTALQLARLQPGSRLSVTLDPQLPASLQIDWAATA